MKIRLALVPLLVAALGCYSPASKKYTLEKAWPAGEIRAVELVGGNGRIEVEAAETDRITLVAEIKARSGGKPEEFVRTSVKGGVLEIRESSRKSTRIPIVIGRGTEIHYELIVPREIALRVGNANGRIEVEGIAGPTELKTVNGRIEVSTPGAEVAASTINGSIRAEFTESFRGGRFETVNGSIRIEVPSDASLDLEVHQVNGSFRTDFPVMVDSSPGPRKTRGAINGGQFTLEVETVNGSVRLDQIRVGDPEIPGMTIDPEESEIEIIEPSVEG